MPHPFDDLTPERVLDAVERAGLACDGRFVALNSYENRVYQIGLEDGSTCVAKFYRPGRWTDEQILEEHAFAAELHDEEIPVVPAMQLGHQTLAHDGLHRFAIFPWRGGRAPELEDAETRRWLGRFIGRIHAVGSRRQFAARPRLDIDTFGWIPRQDIIDRHIVPNAIRAAWESASGAALEAVARAFEAARNEPVIRLHGDCHVGNILWTPAGPHFVDFDDCRNGWAIQDLWMLVSGSAAERRVALDDFLDGYDQFHEFGPVQFRLIEGLRTLRLIHFSHWLASRWDDPAFPAAFPWFGESGYWSQRIVELRDQIEALVADD